MPKSSKLKVIELFAGVGGFRLGLEGWKSKSSSSNYTKKLKNKIPFEIIYSNQWEPATKRQHANEVYLNNFGSKGNCDFSIDELSIKHLKIPCDVLVGGFPCQDYSVASTLRNSKGLIGSKGILWWQIERLLSQLRKKKPPYLILENVDRLLKSPANQRGRDFAIMLRSLDNLGYNVEWRVINAAEYGFPQRRRRVFIFGFRKSSLISKYLSKFSNRQIVEDKGIIGKSFPSKTTPESENLFGENIDLPKDLKKISSVFAANFLNAGVMINGHIETFKVFPDYNGSYVNMKNIIQTKNIEEEFYISPSELKLWKKHKGAKKISRVSKEGFEYDFSEGSMEFPDSIDKPSRTIITSEGGNTPSRFKHVIKTESGRLRRLTPLELERLNMFPDNHTEGYPDTKRAFFMGNALVAGVVERIGASLAEKSEF